MTTIQSLYGPVDNLEGFVHPSYGKTKFLSDRQIIEYAKQISASIYQSGRNNVVVSETGARPLAYICERILKGTGIKWKYVKFPREPTADVYSLLKYYLTPEEQGRIGDDLTKACKEISLDSLRLEKKPLSDILQTIGISKQDRQQQRLSQLMGGTSIAEFIGTPFLYFDEYVDSGTTLQNANMYFNFMSEKVDFKTISYFTYIADSKKYDRIHHSLFDLDSQEESFRQGAYPYENRVDLIGYFYYMNGSDYQKGTLEALRDTYSSQSTRDPSALLESIKKVIDDEHLLPRYQQNFSVPAVRQFSSADHLTRQFLLVLEKETEGDGQAAEFLSQLADMYGPIWSPMPKENHLDFLSGTEKSEHLIRGADGFEKLKSEYAEFRSGILAEASAVCIQRKNEWQNRIDKLLGVECYAH
jgi:hypothetical protein